MWALEMYKKQKTKTLHLKFEISPADDKVQLKVRVVLPFKDQTSTNSVKEQLKDKHHHPACVCQPEN